MKRRFLSDETGGANFSYALILAIVQHIAYLVYSWPDHVITDATIRTCAQQN